MSSEEEKEVEKKKEEAPDDGEKRRTVEISTIARNEKKRHRRESNDGDPKKKRQRVTSSRRNKAVKSIGGWCVFVRGIHEEAVEDDILDKFVECGEVNCIQMNSDRRTGFVKGYAIIQYEKFEDAKNAIKELNESKIYGRRIRKSYAVQRCRYRKREI